VPGVLHKRGSKPGNPDKSGIPDKARQLSSLLKENESWKDRNLGIRKIKQKEEREKVIAKRKLAISGRGEITT